MGQSYKLDGWMDKWMNGWINGGKNIDPRNPVSNEQASH